MEEIINSGELFRKIGSWNLKSNIDSYGNILETEFSSLLSTEQEILDATIQLSKDFVADGDYGAETDDNYPGSIPDIIDFSKVVCFGFSGDGSPFCFDFRDSSNEPSIIWRDDIYWRKLSPNLNSFLLLLETSS
ncbi:MAG: SMI1/KNR4 family protein [Oceanospirillaceae bacterium]